MLKKEWRDLVKNKFMIAVMVAIILIPTIYTAIFVGAIWDPYGRMEQLPVAVVNEDKPVEYKGRELHVGEDLVKNMKKDKSLDFNFVDKKTAEKGLASGKYYMIVRIPENFSQNATTLTENKTQKMELYYVTNPGENYIASKMSETAINKIQQSIREKITSQYTQTMFEQLETIGDGFAEASEGALQLTDGTEKLQAGNGQLSNGLETVADGAYSLQSGSQTLQQGIVAYTYGVSTLQDGTQVLQEKSSNLKAGVDSVANGLTTLKNGSSALLNGMNQMSNQLSEKLSEENTAQIQQLQIGLDEVQSGLQAANQLMTVINQIETGGGNATVQKQQLTTLLATLQQNSSIVLPGSKLAITEMQSGLQTVQTALDREGTTSQEMGMIQAMTGIHDGVAALDSGVGGTNGLKNGVYAYTDGVQSVAAGINQLTANHQALTDGAKQLADGSEQLYAGTGKLLDGSNAIGSGLTELTNGSMTLSESLEEAATEVKSTKTDQSAVDMFAAPVEAIGDTYSHIENNGSAMAAYMMGVGLWVACIAFCTIYPLTKPSGEVTGGVKWWFSKASVYLTISIIQAVVMVLLLKLILGFEPQYMGKTILVAAVASMAFMSVMYFFNVCFGKVGSYLMLVFMVLQLGGSAGTYPLELSAGFYHVIHERMPFTYSVRAFRSTISTGQDIVPQMMVFVGMIIVFNVLSLLVFTYKTRKGELEFKAETIGE